MKKRILLSFGMLCLFVFAVAQSNVIDDAVQGTGLNQHNYSGSGWIHGKTTSTFYKSTHSASNVSGAYVTFTFEGNKIEWYTEKKHTHGIVAVAIDGGAETLIDLFSGTEHHLLVFTRALVQGNHTIKIRATGTKNGASTNYYLIHDYFVTYQGGSQNGPPIVPPDSTNTATGHGALNYFAGGSDNSAFGYNALTSVWSGSRNTALGSNALPGVYKSDGNTAVGYYALNLMKGPGGIGVNGNTAVGDHALHDFYGVFNTAIGSSSGAADPAIFMINATAVGASAKTTASDQVRIGSTTVTSIGGVVSWSTLSDGRFKRDLREDISGLEFVNKLRPVSYTVDKTAIQKFLGIPDSVINSRFASKEKPARQTGFVAQEVEALTKKSKYVFGGVDVPKNDSDLYTIRYAEFVVPLVKAVQELSAKNEEQEKQLAAQQKQIDQLLNKLGKVDGGNGESSTEIVLFQNNPNPFSVNTEIKMVLPETVGNANIIVYNLEGKQLKELQVKGRGNVSTNILGNELSAGMYIYALIVDGKVVDTKRMILTK